MKWVLPTPRAPALSRSPRSWLSRRGAHALRRQTAGRTGPAAPRPGCSCARRPPGLCPSRPALPAPPRCPPLHALESLSPREDANLVGPDPIPTPIPDSSSPSSPPCRPSGGSGPRHREQGALQAPVFEPAQGMAVPASVLRKLWFCYRHRPTLRPRVTCI